MMGHNSISNWHRHKKEIQGKCRNLMTSFLNSQRAYRNYVLSFLDNLSASDVFCESHAQNSVSREAIAPGMLL